jgi:hypothetical protein
MPVTVTAPFSFSGRVLGYSELLEGPREIFPVTDLELFGSGTARIGYLFDLTPSGPGYVLYRGTTYEFEPVPEPLSILTAGTGLGALWVRHRRRRASARQAETAPTTSR